MNAKATRTKGSGIRDHGSKKEPSVLQIAYQSDIARCFYCKSLLLITDDKARHAACSNNCESRLIQLTEIQIKTVRRAWQFEKQKNKVSDEVAVEAN